MPDVLRVARFCYSIKAFMDNKDCMRPPLLSDTHWHIWHSSPYLYGKNKAQWLIEQLQDCGAEELGLMWQRYAELQHKRIMADVLQKPSTSKQQHSIDNEMKNLVEAMSLEYPSFALRCEAFRSHRLFHPHLGASPFKQLKTQYKIRHPTLPISIACLSSSISTTSTHPRTHGGTPLFYRFSPIKSYINQTT